MLDLLDKCQTETRKDPANVAKSVEIAQELVRSVNAPIKNVLSSEVPVTARRHTAGFTTEVCKDEARIAELEYVEIMTVPRHKEFLDEVRLRHFKEVSVWKNSAENTDSLINDVKVVKADCVKMSMERNLRFEEHVRTPQALVNANVEGKVKLTDFMAKIRKILESGCWINRSNYFVTIAKLIQKVQR